MKPSERIYELQMELIGQWGELAGQRAIIAYLDEQAEKKD